VWFLLVSAGPRGRVVKEGLDSGAMRDFALDSRPVLNQMLNHFAYRFGVVTCWQTYSPNCSIVLRPRKQQRYASTWAANDRMRSLARSRERETDRFGAGQGR
jgi:hypothetical protein